MRSDAELEEDEEGLSPQLRAAAQDERVIAAVTGFFRQNAHADPHAPNADDPARCRELAVRTVQALLDPATARLADVGGLRFHLALPSAPYPGPAVIHAYVWDEDSEVWRLLGDVAFGNEHA